MTESVTAIFRPLGTGPSNIPRYLSPHKIQESLIPNGERPFPDLPPGGRRIYRQEQHLSGTDQVFGRDLPDLGCAAIQRVVSVVAHHEIVPRLDQEFHGIG